MVGNLSTSLCSFVGQNVHPLFGVVRTAKNYRLSSYFCLLQMVQDELGLCILERVLIVGGGRNRNCCKLAHFRVADGGESHIKLLHILFPCSFLQSNRLVWSIYSSGLRVGCDC